MDSLILRWTISADLSNRVKKMKILFLTARAATFELESDTVYYAEKPYKVAVNGNVHLKKFDTNVFSLYDLEPDTEYLVNAGNEQMVLKTPSESVTLNVRDFHAKGDGINDDTEAIQAAIMCCPPNGRVVIPKGNYLIRPLFLKSHIRLELKREAQLLGETDREKYPVLPGRVASWDGGKEYYYGTWEGRAESAFAALITGIGVTDVQIYGEGILNGQADKSDWWVNDIVKRIAWRPRGIFLNRCEKVTLQGITCKNTASWNQHPFFSKEISYIDMKLENPKENPNTDGINPESCDTVAIIGCDFSVGDDCIAIKSGKAEMGKLLKTPCRNIVIRNCHMKYGHGAVTLGSEMSAGIQDVSVSRCLFTGTDRGLRIKTQRGRGNTAVVEGVSFGKICMNRVKAPLVVNMFYKARNDAPDTEYKYNLKKQVVDEHTPCFGSFHFHDIVAKEVEWAAGVFWGLPEQPIASISMEDCSFRMKEEAEAGKAIMTLNGPDYRKAGLVLSHVKRVALKNVIIEGAEGEVYQLDSVEELRES